MNLFVLLFIYLFITYRRKTKCTIWLGNFANFTHSHSIYCRFHGSYLNGACLVGFKSLRKFMCQFYIENLPKWKSWKTPQKKKKKKVLCIFFVFSFLVLFRTKSNYVTTRAAMWFKCLCPCWCCINNYDDDGI